MSQGPELPLSGYVIEQVYAQHQLLEHKDPGDLETQGSVDIGWDWWLLDAQVFEVRLSANVEPSDTRDDRIAASVIGRFRSATEDPTVPLLDFVRLQGPAILLPYLRQALSALTSLSFYGTYYLPSINVVALMADFDPEETTGARQLAEGAKKPRKQVKGAAPKARTSKSRAPQAK